MQRGWHVCLVRGLSRLEAGRAAVRRNSASAATICLLHCSTASSTAGGRALCGHHCSQNACKIKLTGSNSQFISGGTPTISVEIAIFCFLLRSDMAKIFISLQLQFAFSFAYSPPNITSCSGACFWLSIRTASGPPSPGCIIAQATSCSYLVKSPSGPLFALSL